MGNRPHGINAVACKYHHNSLTAETVVLPRNDSALLAFCEAYYTPVLFLVDETGRRALCRLACVSDCGVKSGKKAIAACIPKDVRAIPAVDGDFDQVTGHTKTSIQALLRDAAKRRANGERVAPAYVLGIGSQNIDPPDTFLDIVAPEKDPARQMRERYIGVSRESDLVRKRVLQAAETNVPVLISGPSGTGKEICARCVHDFSPRSRQPYISVNSAAIPETLIESDLFGTVEGAFTGATKPLKGKFEAADTGTLFLDEVGELSPAAQAKLLRVLETGEVVPVGSPTARRKVDVKLICASNRSLPALLPARAFRTDLYYRICVFPIRTTAIKDRPQDLPVLARHCWQSVTHGERPYPKALDEVLADCPWPGNVRELRSVLVSLHIKFRDRLPGQAEFKAELKERGSPIRTLGHVHVTPAVHARVQEGSFLDDLCALIQRIKKTLRPVSSKTEHELAAETLESCAKTVRELVDELDEFRDLPARFETTDAWNAVLNLRAHLKEWLKAADKSPDHAREYYDDHLAGSDGACNTAIIKAIDALRKTRHSEAVNQWIQE